MKINLGQKFFFEIGVLKLALILIFSAGLVFSLFLYYKYSKMKSLLDLKISEKISNEIGRKITVGGIKYSVLNGLLINKACIKEKDGKTDFFCFEKGNIKIEFLPAFKNNLIFSDVNFENGSLNLKKTAAGWNFSDLIALLPKNNKPIHLNWNAKNFSFKNFSIQLIPDAERLNDIQLENANIIIKHRSNTGGNFALSADAVINAEFDGKFISGKFRSDSDFNFEYANLKSAEADLEIGDIVFNDITAKKLYMEFEGFNLDKKNRNKKFTFKGSLEELLIPYANPLSKEIKEKTEIIGKILGKTVQAENEFSVKTFSFNSDYDGESVKNRCELDSNLLYISIDSNLNLKKNLHTVSIDLKNQAKNMKVKSDSSLFNPEPEPAMSETISKYFKEGIISLEKYITVKMGD